MMNNIERLEEGWFFHDHAWMLLHTILKEIRNCEHRDSLLDFGAGSGLAAAVIKAVFPEMGINVLDSDINAIELWKERDLHIVDTLFRKFEYKFAIILCSHVLEHSLAPEVILKKFAEIAHHLILIVPDNAGQDIDPDHKHIFNRVSFKKLIDDNINYKRMKYYPLYHPHINNLVAVIDL